MRASRILPAFLVLALAALAPACASPRTALAPGGPAALVDADGVALGGYDPVAYFTDARAVPGRAEWTAEHGDATYRFRSAESRSEFLADPARYEPAYGGWCAWALADGEGALVEVDPRSFLVEDGRLFLFYDGAFADTRAWWTEGAHGELAARADANWDRLLSARGR